MKWLFKDVAPKRPWFAVLTILIALLVGIFHPVHRWTDWDVTILTVWVVTYFFLCEPHLFHREDDKKDDDKKLA